MKPMKHIYTLIYLIAFLAIPFSSCSQQPEGNNSLEALRDRIQQLETDNALLKQQLAQYSTPKKSSGNDNHNSNTKSAHDPITDQALDIVNSIVYKNGDFLYFAGEESAGTQYHFQLKSPKTAYQIQPVSDADKLNGYSWRWEYKIWCSAYRERQTFSYYGMPTDRQWEAWSEGDGAPFLRIYFSVKDSKWEIKAERQFLKHVGPYTELEYCNTKLLMAEKQSFLD